MVRIPRLNRGSPAVPALGACVAGPAELGARVGAGSTRLARGAGIALLSAAVVLGTARGPADNPCAAPPAPQSPALAVVPQQAPPSRFAALRAALRPSGPDTETLTLTVQRDSPFLEGPRAVKVPRQTLNPGARLESERVVVLIDRCLPEHNDETFAAQGVVSPWSKDVTHPWDSPTARALPAASGPPSAFSRLAATTAFVSAEKVHAAVSEWFGAPWPGQLKIYSNAYLVGPDNTLALFDPHSKSVILGVSRYRDAPTGEVRWFEAGSDPDSVFHELGHVVVSLALPHADIFDLTVKEYSESYGHTLAMVMPLRDRAYVAAFLTAAGGDWSTPNPVSQLALAPPASPDGSTPVATSDAVGHNYFQHPEAAPYARAAQDLNVNYALLQGFTAQFQAAGHGAIEAVQRAGDLIARLRTLALFDHMGQVRFDPSAERGIVALFKAASRVLDDGQHSVLLDTLMKFVGEEVVGKAVDQLQQYERALPSWTLPPDWKEPGAMTAFLNAHSRDLNLPEGFSLDFLTSEQRTDGTVRVLGQMRYGDTLTANVAALVWSGTDGRLLDAHPAVDEPVASSPAIRALAAFKPKFEPEVPASMPFLVGTWGIRVEHAQPIPTAVSKLPIHHRRIAFVGK